MGYREIDRVETQTGEVFYLGNRQEYWHGVYLKERPELLPYKSNKSVQSTQTGGIKIGPEVTKASYSSMESCESHPYDFIDQETTSIDTSGIFYQYEFINDLFYIQEDYIEKYKEIQNLVFIQTLGITQSKRFFVKVAEGLFRERKREYYIYDNSNQIYIVNADTMGAWFRFKNIFHKNDVINLKDVISVNWIRTRWGTRFPEGLTPFYSDVEVIKITHGIYRTRKTIPDKVPRKFTPIPNWETELINISNKEDYIYKNPDFLCFKVLSGDDYLVNIDYINDWHKYIKEVCINDSSSFLYKKYLYCVHPFEYKLVMRGIFKKTITVDPFIDSHMK